MWPRIYTEVQTSLAEKHSRYYSESYFFSAGQCGTFSCPSAHALFFTLPIIQKVFLLEIMYKIRNRSYRARVAQLIAMVTTNVR